MGIIFGTYTRMFEEQLVMEPGTKDVVEIVRTDRRMAQKLIDIHRKQGNTRVLKEAQRNLETWRMLDCMD